VLEQFVTHRSIGVGHVFPRHAHAGWSLGVVQAGCGRFRCAGAVHTGGPGAITVLHPGEVHDSWVHPEYGLDYIVVDLPEPAVAVLVDDGPGTPTFPSRVIDDEPCATALRAAHQLRRCGDTRIADSVFAMALDRLFRRHSRRLHPDPEPGASAMVEDVRRYLDDHAAHDVTLAELAGLASVSVPTLVRRYRAEVGMAPHAYLISRRVEIARASLLAGAAVATAAAAAGFADQSHLHRHFTRLVGVTPGRFRAGR
jgi:AraC-like DNA-binding protein